MEDWSAQVNRIEKSYEALFKEDGNVAPELLNKSPSHMASLDVVESTGEFHGPNRFPPRHKPSVLASVNLLRYEGTDGEGLPEDINELVMAAHDNRENVISHYDYLLNTLAPLPPESEFRELQATITDLKEMHEVAHELIGRIEQVLNERETNEIASPFFTKCCQMLRDDLSSTMMFILSLTNIAEEALYAPRGTTNKLSGIVTDWTNHTLMQEQMLTKAGPSLEAKYYALTMHTQRLPVINSVYQYLCHMAADDYTLVVCDHMFDREGKELEQLLQFLTTPTPSVHGVGGGDKRASTYTQGLYLDNCGLTDDDIELMTQYLADFPSLTHLCLRKNEVSSAGCTTLSTLLWELGLPLQALMLDDNDITSSGALMLSKSLHRCRHLARLSLNGNPIGDSGFYYLVRATMNKLRKARPGLPRPAEVDEEEEGNADFDSDAEEDEDDQIAQMRRKFNRNKHKDHNDSSSDDSDDQTASDAGDSELEDDAFTATGEGESVYSEKPVYVSSKQTTSFAQTLQLDGAKGSRGSKHKRGKKTPTGGNNDSSGAPLSKFQALYKRVRIKLLAFSRFLQLRRRGLLLRSLSVARCGLGPYSAQVAAHAFSDNTYLHTLDLSRNAIGHAEVEQANVKALQELAASTGVRTLRLRQCGLFEDGLTAIVKGANHAESSLRELDLSGNHCGPTGAAIIASARNLHVDQASFSLGFKSQQQDVFKFGKKGSSAFHGEINQTLSVAGESKATI